MKNLTLLAAAAALAFATGARADDPPAPPVKPAKPDPAPAAAKHENKISDEAKALFEKLSKTVNGPLQKGVKEVDGTITTETPRGATAMKFTVKSPGVVTVEPVAGEGGGKGQGGGKGGGMRGGRGAGGVDNVIAYAFGIFRPAEDAEFDAEIVKKDGKDVLSLTKFRNGEQTEHRDITVDANGLVVSAAVAGTMPRPDGQKVEFKNEAAYTWTKNGDSYRLDKVETKGERNTTLEFTYADAGGVSLPASWKMTIAGKDGAAGAAIETKVGDLVVDGKKVEAPKKAEGGEPKKGDKKEKDDDDDEKKDKKGDK
jgi:hypothetical protein